MFRTSTFVVFATVLGLVSPCLAKSLPKDRKPIAHSKIVFLRPAGSKGPNVPTNYAQGQDSGFTEAAWTNPQNATSAADGGAYASTWTKAVTGGANDRSYWLDLYTPQLGVPNNATITAIQVTARAKTAIPYSIIAGDIKSEQLYFSLFDASGLRTAGYEHDFASTAWETFNADPPGSALWFTTWTPSDVNDIAFGVRVQALYTDEQDHDTTHRELDLDWVAIEVDYTTP